MLATAAFAMTLVVAALHVVFMVLETFLWTTPRGRKIFGQTPEDAEKTKVLAQNQGVYNGALAAGLVYAAIVGQRDTTIVLLAFVVVVGIYGGITAKPTIFVLQALPGAIALGLTIAAGL
jgi:putative membrane protein